MKQRTLKWRAPRDFARHAITLSVWWFGLGTLWFIEQWIVTKQFPGGLFAPLAFVIYSCINWNAVPRYFLGRKSVRVISQNDAVSLDKEGVRERDYDKIQSYSIRPLTQICNLKIVEFDGDIEHQIKSKRLPPFVFDPRVTNEKQLREILARKLPDKEIRSEETQREYSQLGKPLISWRKSAPQFLADIAELATWFAVIGAVLFGVFSLFSYFFCGDCKQEGTTSSSWDVPALLALLGVALAFSWWQRPRFALCENGATCTDGGKTSRFLWSSVASYSVTAQRKNARLHAVNFHFNDADYRMCGNVFCILPAFVFDTRETDEARVLALLREKLPGKSAEEREQRETERTIALLMLANEQENRAAHLKLR